jgi:hypothetical protein
VIYRAPFIKLDAIDGSVVSIVFCFLVYCFEIVRDSPSSFFVCPAPFPSLNRSSGSFQGDHTVMFGIASSV